MSAADLVTCARCFTEYDADDQRISWVPGDEEWRCTYGDECDEALLESHAEGGINAY